MAEEKAWLVKEQLQGPCVELDVLMTSRNKKADFKLVCTEQQVSLTHLCFSDSLKSYGTTPIHKAH